MVDIGLQLKEGRDASSVPSVLVPVLMDFGTVPFQNVWHQGLETVVV